MIYIHQDELNAIIITPDGNQGVVVQLVSYVKRMIPNAKQILEEHSSMKVEDSKKIVVRMDNGELNKHFKTHLAAAVSEYRQKLVMFQQNREHIEGALKDYVRS